MTKMEEPGNRTGSGVRFIALDALRGIAAFIVLFRHVTLNGTFADTLDSHLAVDFFFLLSGFVLEPSLPKEGQPVYMLKRVVRLWPTYLAGSGIRFMAALLFGGLAMRSEVLRGVIPGLFLLPSPGTVDPFPILKTAWSLFAEFWVANLLFAFLYKKTLAPVIVAVVLLSLLAMIWEANALKTLNFGYTQATVFWSIPRVLFSFGLGCLIRRWQPSKMPTFGAVTFFAVCLMLIASLLLPSALGVFVQLAFVAFFFPALLVVCSGVRLGPRLAALCEALGAASYPLYCLHPGLGLIARALWGRGFLHFPLAIYCVAAAILWMSWLFAIYIDAPVRAVLGIRIRSAQERISNPGRRSPHPPEPDGLATFEDPRRF